MIIDIAQRRNKFQQIVSPYDYDEGVWFHQDAWFQLGIFDKDFITGYTLRKKGNGVYAFIIKGDVTIDGISLNARDGLGIWETDKFIVEVNSADAEVLLMEVPMNL